MLLQREIRLGLESFPSFNFSDIFWRTSVTEIVDIPANRLLNQENTISAVVLVDNEDRINDPVIENNIKLNYDHLVRLNPREVKRKKNHISIKQTFKTKEIHLECFMAWNTQEILYDRCPEVQGLRKLSGINNLRGRNL